MKANIRFLLAAGYALAVIVVNTGCSSGSRQSAGVPVSSETITNLATSNEAVLTEKADAPIQKIPPALLNTTPGVAEVLKLAQGGVAESVLMSYVESTPTAFNPTVEEILYMNDLGIPPKVVSAMLRHGSEIRDRLTAQEVSGGEAPAGVAQTAPAFNNAVAPAADSAPGAGVAQVAPEPVPVGGQEQQPMQVSAPQAPMGMPEQAVSFYPSLAPYGSWMQVEGYGWCWQPSVAVVNTSWTPYSDSGRWVYTDCGWYWQSDYSWGWAPFHYGRWFRHAHCGWVWAPDSVWGPAWVTWRHTPAYCGWAPIPPGGHYSVGIGFTYYGSSVESSFGFGLGYSDYVFVSYNYFGTPHWRSHCIPKNHARNVYHNSTVINNYVVGNNNVIINNGVGTERVRAFQRSEIKPVPVRDFAHAAGKQVKPDQLTRESNRQVIYRRQVQDQAPPMPASLASRPSNPGMQGGGSPTAIPSNQLGSNGTRQEAVASGQMPVNSSSGNGVPRRPPVGTPGVPTASPASAGNTLGAVSPNASTSSEAAVRSAPSSSAVRNASSGGTPAPAVPATSAHPGLSSRPTQADPATVSSATTPTANPATRSQPTRSTVRSETPRANRAPESTRTEQQPVYAPPVNTTTRQQYGSSLNAPASNWSQPATVQRAPAPVQTHAPAQAPAINSYPSRQTPVNQPSYAPPAASVAPARIGSPVESQSSRMPPGGSYSQPAYSSPPASTPVMRAPPVSSSAPANSSSRSASESAEQSTQSGGGSLRGGRSGSR